MWCHSRDQSFDLGTACKQKWRVKAVPYTIKQSLVKNFTGSKKELQPLLQRQKQDQKRTAKQKSSQSRREQPTSFKLGNKLCLRVKFNIYTLADYTTWVALTLFQYCLGSTWVLKISIWTLLSEMFTQHCVFTLLGNGQQHPVNWWLHWPISTCCIFIQSTVMNRQSFVCVIPTLGASKKYLPLLNHYSEAAVFDGFLAPLLLIPMLVLQHYVVPHVQH